ncbi:MAG: hypothetical protein MZW92_40295 [Comamonadaceae bacterium]|nr:hypothetical protein [Comamonadaceae bacterium]
MPRGRDARRTPATAHARAFAAQPPAGTGDCESCHGPRSKHVENPTSELAIDPASRGAVGDLPASATKAGRGSAGRPARTTPTTCSCTSCHTVMSKQSERALLTKRDRGRDPATPATPRSARSSTRCRTTRCAKAGWTARAATTCTGRKPGAADASPRRTTRCFTCHAEKRGPFVWEHAPVREELRERATTPHGSNQRTLLTSKDPFLCLSCHNYGGHINLPRYNRTSNLVRQRLLELPCRRCMARTTRLAPS